MTASTQQATETSTYAEHMRPLIEEATHVRNWLYKLAADVPKHYGEPPAGRLAHDFNSIIDGLKIHPLFEYNPAIAATAETTANSRPIDYFTLHLNEMLRQLTKEIKTFERVEHPVHPIYRKGDPVVAINWDDVRKPSEILTDMLEQTRTFMHEHQIAIEASAARQK